MTHLLLSKYQFYQLNYYYLSYYYYLSRFLQSHYWLLNFNYLLLHNKSSPSSNNLPYTISKQLDKCFNSYHNFLYLFSILCRLYHTKHNVLDKIQHIILQIHQYNSFCKLQLHIANNYWDYHSKQRKKDHKRNQKNQ